MACECDVSCLCEKVCKGEGRYTDEDFKSSVLILLCSLNAQGAANVSVPVVATEYSITLNTTSQEAVAANPDRQPGSWLKNIGVLNAYVSMSNLATAGQPTLLSPGGVFIIPDNYFGQISGVTLSGNTDLEIVELTPAP